MAKKYREYANIIAPDGSERIVRPSDKKKFSLTELQHYVDGLIEIVQLRPGYGGGTAYCNEEGKLKNLPVNRRAGDMACICADDFIVGNFVIVKKEEVKS